MTFNTDSLNGLVNDAIHTKAQLSTRQGLIDAVSAEINGGETADDLGGNFADVTTWKSSDVVDTLFSIASSALGDWTTQDALDSASYFVFLNYVIMLIHDNWDGNELFV